MFKRIRQFSKKGLMQIRHKIQNYCSKAIAENKNSSLKHRDTGITDRIKTFCFCPFITVQTETITTKHRAKIAIMCRTPFGVKCSHHYATKFCFLFSFSNKHANTILSVLKLKNR